MLRIVFWILFCLEFLPAIFVIIGGVIGLLTGSPLNNVLLLVVPAGAIAAFVGCVGLWFYFTSSKFALGVLCLPFLLIPVLFVQNQLGDRADREEHLGNMDFKQPGKQRLANAIVSGDVQAVKAAIPGAGDLKVPGERGLPILLFAMHSAPQDKKPNPAIIAALLDAGADPNAASPSGELPLEAAKEFEVVKLLVEHGADPNKKGLRGPVWFNAFGDAYGGVYRGNDMFNLYRAHGLRLEGVNARGQGPIAAAAAGHDWRSLRFMLENGLDPKGVTIHTQTLSEALQTSATVWHGDKDLEACIKIVNRR